MTGFVFIGKSFQSITAHALKVICDWDDLSQLSNLLCQREEKNIMKQLISLTDKDISGSDKLSSAKPRIAVGIVLFDDQNNIALSNIGIWDLHGLPGGGVDEGEDFLMRLLPKRL